MMMLIRTEDVNHDVANLTKTTTSWIPKKVKVETKHRGGRNGAMKRTRTMKISTGQRNTASERVNATNKNAAPKQRPKKSGPYNCPSLSTSTILRKNWACDSRTLCQSCGSLVLPISITIMC